MLYTHSKMFEDDNKTMSAENKQVITKVVLPLLGIIALILAVGAGSLYLVKVKPELIGLAPNQISSADPQEVEKLVNKVGELIVLPEGENPNVATVNDLSQVQSQQFFALAEVGDKVLIYPNAKKAYLYRPSWHRLIEVGVVDAGTGEGAVGGAQDSTLEIITPTPLPTVEPEETEEEIPTPEPSPTSSQNTSPTPTSVTFQ